MKRKIEYCVRLLFVLLTLTIVSPMKIFAAEDDLPQLETPIVTWDPDYPGKVTWDNVPNSGGYEVRLYKLNKNDNPIFVHKISVDKNKTSCNLGEHLAKNSVLDKSVYVTVKAKGRKGVNRESEIGTTDLYFDEAEMDWEPDYGKKIYEYVTVDEDNNWSLFKAFYYEKTGKKLWNKEDYYYYDPDDDYDYDEDCYRPGGPYYPSDNEWREGWSENRTYYYEAGVRVRNRWKKVDGNWYYFGSDGRKQTSSFIGQYYVDKYGIMVDNDWFSCEGVKYYAKPGGELTKGWKYIDGNWHYFNQAGAEQRQVFIDGNNNTKYYVDKYGIMLDNKWFKNEFQWYYAKPGGNLAKGWEYIDMNWYYFENNGIMVTNQWAQSNGAWFYLGDDGTMLRDRWVTYNGDRYYLKSGGDMAIGETWINGIRYYFNPDGSSRRGALIQ